MSETILIISRDADERQQLQQTFESAGCCVRWAGDAASALDKVASHPPDAIVLDGALCATSDLDLLRALREKTSSRDTSILLIADSENDEIVAEGLEVGATDFVLRPVSQRVIRARVDNAIQFRKSQHRIRDHKESVEIATTQKADFLASMSHEIRTPMTSILGFTDVLYHEGDITKAPPVRVEAIRTIRRCSEHLLGLINDILDLSKVEAGRLEITPFRCSVFQVLSEVADVMKGRAQEKGLPLEIRFDGPIPATIHTDPGRLRQILINLVSNAVKFTERGRVTVTTSLLQEPGTTPLLQFAVTDTGIGITPEQQARLFQPFSQATAQTQTKYGGTGLGLSISQQLAEMLGGEIVLASEPGRGSTFTLTIATGPLEGVPLTREPTTNRGTGSDGLFKAPLSPNSLSCRVLVAEDGPDNQRLIKYLLTKAGAHVVIADNGCTAVDLALSARKTGSPFDVILMDMHMPKMDGYDATSHLRRAEYSGPIIALTANAMREDRQKCLNAGCDAYCPKPIDRHELIQLVAKYSAPKTNAQGAANPTENGQHGPLAGRRPESEANGLRLAGDLLDSVIDTHA